MSPVVAFAVQFLWFLVAWSVIATFFVSPRLRHADEETALSVWIAPHLFRVLGVGLLVPNLAPGMPFSFALSTAVGDAVTAVLALAALVGLRRRAPRARTRVWIFNVFGSADLALAGVQAARAGAAAHLEAQWYVPVLGVPLMIVTHWMVFRTLLDRGRSASR